MVCGVISIRDARTASTARALVGLEAALGRRVLEGLVLAMLCKRLQGDGVTAVVFGTATMSFRRGS